MAEALAGKSNAPKAGAQGDQETGFYLEGQGKKSAQSCFQSGEKKFAIKDYDGAVKDFTEAIRRKPDYAEAYFGRARAKNELFDDKGALLDCNDAIRLGLKNKEVYYRSAGAKYNIACSYYNRAAGSNRGEDFRMAFAHFDGAIHDFKEVVRQDPDYLKAYLYLGYSYYYKDDYDQAKNYFAFVKIWIAEKDNGWAYFGFADGMLKNMEWKENNIQR